MQCMTNLISYDPHILVKSYLKVLQGMICTLSLHDINTKGQDHHKSQSSGNICHYNLEIQFIIRNLYDAVNVTSKNMDVFTMNLNSYY